MNPLNWTHLVEQYRGKWVALKDDHCTVVASGSTLKNAKKAAEEQGYPHSFLTRVPQTFKNFIGSSF